MRLSGALLLMAVGTSSTLLALTALSAVTGIGLPLYTPGFVGGVFGGATNSILESQVDRLERWRNLPGKIGAN